MKTESHSINDVLAKNATSFFIPPFQRAYAWGKPEIDRYFSDVLRIIYSELDSKQHDKLEHFFGTVVIKEEKYGFANRSVVVDGQQRLTTTLLFLIALRDIESDVTNQEFITQNYLINNASTFQDKIKLKQVTKDWESYRSLVNKEQPKPGILSNAYLIFCKLINDTKNKSPQIKLENYIAAIRRMNVAVIFLDERPYKGEDPQIIFETLNSLGKPLTLSDLVRNFVLLNMDSANQSDIYEKTWHPKIESVLNENTSEFFRNYLQYKTTTSIKAVSDNNTKEIYHLFKDFVETKFPIHKDFIDDIVRYVDWYKWIISEVINDKISQVEQNNKIIIELIRNIFHDIKTEAFKPFVLGLFEFHQNNKLSDEMLISALSTIRTYLIRRRILGLTQGENKNIVLLSNRIEDIAKANVYMFNLLSTMFYKMRFPNDEEIKSILTTMKFYEEIKKYSRFILGKIEEHNTKVAVDFRNPNITIEHIMPQKLTSAWETELGDNFENIHKTYLHNIGNLILTEFNSEIGNKSFTEKKLKLSASSLNYRLEIIKNDFWNEISIKEHQEKMIKYFLETFDIPEIYQYKDNWNAGINDSSIFSPLDNDASDIAGGNKPIKIKIDDKEILVSTWQDVFIAFIKYIKDNQNSNFQFILDNQTELFGNETTILTWANLKLRIEDKEELTTRYKTFDGKFWNKTKFLIDEEIFIHVNISATSCMNRIANVMNKFNIDENSVEIVLR